MYNISDKKSAIKEIQTYLHFINDAFYPDLPSICIDGVYGDETRASVIEFQKANGLLESGVVDYITFTELYKLYQEAIFIRDSNDLIIHDAELFPFKKGDSGTHIYTLNAMLNDLRNSYESLPYVKQNDYFSTSTEDSVRELRKIYLLEDDVLVDQALYYRIESELRLK